MYAWESTQLQGGQLCDSPPAKRWPPGQIQRVTSSPRHSGPPGPHPLPLCSAGAAERRPVHNGPEVQTQHGLLPHVRGVRPRRPHVPGAARRGHGVGTHSEPSRTPTPREVVHLASVLPEGLNPAVSCQQGSGPAGLLENFLRRVQCSSGRKQRATQSGDSRGCRQPGLRGQGLWSPEPESPRPHVPAAAARPPRAGKLVPGGQAALETPQPGHITSRNTGLSAAPHGQRTGERKLVILH